MTLHYGFRCVVPLAVSLGNNAGSHRPANPALPISADHASSSNIKLQAGEQTRIWNNYAMALIRLKDCRINIKQKIIHEQFTAIGPPSFN